MEGLGDNVAQFIELISDMINNLISDNNLNGGKILGLGIGTPGPVNIEDDRILSPPNMKMLKYLPFRRMMEDRIGIPVFLHRDANIIIGGILATEYFEYLEIVKEVVFFNRLNRNSENMIVKTMNGDKAGIIGAGEIALDHFFKNFVGQEHY